MHGSCLTLHNCLGSPPPQQNLCAMRKEKKSRWQRKTRECSLMNSAWSRRQTLCAAMFTESRNRWREDVGRSSLEPWWQLIAAAITDVVITVIAPHVPPSPPPTTMMIWWWCHVSGRQIKGISRSAARSTEYTRRMLGQLHQTNDSGLRVNNATAQARE